MSAFIEQYQEYKQGVVRRRHETPITPRQQAVLEYVDAHIKQYGFAPAHRDICRHFDMKSTRSAAVHLRELEAKGAIEMKRGVARAIRVISRAINDGERLSVSAFTIIEGPFFTILEGRPPASGSGRRLC